MQNMSSLVLKLIKEDPLEIPRLLVKSILFFMSASRQEEEYYQRRAKLAHFLAKIGLYESKHLRALSLLVKSGDNVIDVGANFGVYTANLSRLCGNAGRVHAFEPMSFVFQALKASTASLSNVEYYNVGISDGKASEAVIHMPLLFNKIPEPALSTLMDIDSECKVEKIILKKVDDFKDGLPRISFIKVDIEGYEREFFDGAAALITRDRPVIQFEANKFEGFVEFADAFCARNSYKVKTFEGNSTFLEFDYRNKQEQNLYLMPA